MSTNAHIEAVTVNHNTSLFAELMLRSLRHHHRLPIRMTVVDNHSTDGEELESLKRYISATGIGFATSRFHVAPDTSNSHGECLRDFVMGHPDCTHYLFIDPDVYFLTTNTIDALLEELDADASAFGIMPVCTWDGKTDHTPRDGIDERDQDARIRYSFQWPGTPESSQRKGELTRQPRIHPYCSLLKNTPTLQAVAREVGFSFGCTFAPHGGRLWDTMGLATAVMKTHGYHFLESSAMVHHFFCVSYDEQGLKDKREKCQEALAKLRGKSAAEGRV